MKKIFFFFIVINFTVNVIFSQDETKKLVNSRVYKKECFPIEIQIGMLKEFILQYYGESFKYYNELKNGLYKLAPGSKDEKTSDYYFVYLKNILNDKIVDKIKLKKTPIEGRGFNISVIPGEINKLVDIQRFNASQNIRSWTIPNLILKDSILWDQEIVKYEEIPEAYWTKIISRSYTRSYSHNQYGLRSDLFKTCVAGVAIPYGNDGVNSKILGLDNEFHSIIFFDANIRYYENEPLNGCYGYGGTGYGQFYNPTGITLGRSWVSPNNILTYPLYIADYTNSRVIRVNYNINQFNTTGLGFFNDNSYEVYSYIHHPYDVAYCKTYSINADKIWVSQKNIYHSHLLCLNNAGEIVDDFVGYKESGSNQIQYFNEAANIRLAVYDYDFRAIAFIDKDRNSIVTCLLDSNGTASYETTDQGKLIISPCVITFPSNDTINSVQFQNYNSLSHLWPYVWVTSPSYIHCFKMNATSGIQYLASTRKPKSTDYQFSNLLNTITADENRSIVTIEKWNMDYGFRQFWPFCDIHSDTLNSYCDDSSNVMRFKATFTNDCWLYISAYRQNNLGNWENIKIKKYNRQDKDDYFIIVSQPAGWNQSDIDRYIDLKLDLPLEDYYLGGHVKLNVKMYPVYNYPDSINEHNVSKDYYADVKKNCNPKPGGCPFIYVKNIDTVDQLDNNILHRSEFSEFQGQDIRDLYKLDVRPSIVNNNISISVVENEGDHSYFDQFKLYAVDHQQGTIAGVTENNQIVIYNPSEAVSTDSASLLHLNYSSDITELIKYNSSRNVKAYIDDSIYAHYPLADRLLRLLTKNKKISMNNSNDKNDGSKGKPTDGRKNTDGNNTNGQKVISENTKINLSIPPKIALVALLGNLDTLIPASQKNWAASLTANAYSESYYSGQFARREKSSEVILPLFNYSQGTGEYIHDIQLYNTSNSKINYLAVVPVYYNGFTVTEIPLSSAIHTSTGDVTELLLYLDASYAEMDTTAIIKMLFNTSSLQSPPDGMVRDYVIETNGRYELASSRDNFIKNVQNQIPLTNKLYNNYPNPFNPSTNIKYDISKNVNVKIIIYNILGQEVKLLVNEFKKAGSYNIKFDGTNLASGIYFYRIEVRQAGSSTCDFVESKKMVLIK